MEKDARFGNSIDLTEQMENNAMSVDIHGMETPAGFNALRQGSVGMPTPTLNINSGYNMREDQLNEPSHLIDTELSITNNTPINGTS